MSDFEEARKAMIAKRFGGNTHGASTGGAGTVRRKNKGAIKAGGGKRWFFAQLVLPHSSLLIAHLSIHTDDKKLSGVLKKMSLTDIKGVEEVNIFKNDGTVIHITAPKSKCKLSLLALRFDLAS